MSQVTVTYGTRQIKVKCTPSTLLGEVKRNACSVLQLDPDKYDLKHGKSLVSPALPFRLSNIVQNGKLQLVPAKGGRSGGKVRIKLAALDLPPNFSGALQGEFDTSITLWNVLQHFEKKSGINFTQRAVPSHVGGSGRLVYEAPTVQLFNRLIRDAAEMDQPLTAFGLESGSAVLNIRFEKTDAFFEDAVAAHASFTSQELATVPNENAQRSTRSSAEPSAASELSTESEQTVSTPEPSTPDANSSGNSSAGGVEASGVPSPAEPSVAPGTYKNVEVYLPSQKPRVVGAPDEGEREMTVSQFARYQAHLKNTYEGGQSGPLMTKALREAAEKEKAAKIRDVSIRVRLPDESHLHATFSGQDTVASVYDFVRSHLRTPERDFVLFVTPPRYVPEPHERLSYDLKFGSRVVMFFEWKTGAHAKGDRVLSDRVLSQARPITETIDTNAPEPGPSASSTSDTKPKKTGAGFRPKWMKLGK